MFDSRPVDTTKSNAAREAGLPGLWLNALHQKRQARRLDAGTKIMKNWTHKVVKLLRGTNGRLFALGTATTGDRAKCVQYAREFAEEQRAARIMEAWITVKTRSAPRTVFEAHVNVFNPCLAVGRDNKEIDREVSA